MAYCTVNGHRVLRGELTVPRVGIWHADLVVDTREKITGPVEIAFGDGAIVYRGSIARGDVFQETFACKILGGGGGLSRVLPAKFYRGAPLRLPLQDLLGECGERLSATAELAVLDGLLLKWCRTKGTAAKALAELVEDARANWRVLSDGSVWVGSERWPELAFAHDLLRHDPAEGRLEIASELPQLRPGVTFNGEKISAVTHTIGPDRVRTEAYTEKGGSLVDRLKAPFTNLIKSVMRQVDFHKPYPAKVIHQEGDGTLHLQPDSDVIPGLTGVPIRYGVPGVTAKVPPGARCMVEFENGDPRAPVVTAFEPGALVELSLDGGVRPIARANDHTGEGTLSITHATSPTGDVTLTFAYVDGSGVSAAPLILTFKGGAPPAASSPITTFPIAGKILDGAPRLRA